MRTPFYQSKIFLWSLFIVTCLVWFFVLEARSLIPTDEGRYAEMGREMLLNNDWVTTRLNDIKYFEKPPLQTWATALAYQLFGIGEWQARLWMGICAMLGILSVYFTALRIFNARVAYLAAIMLGSCLFWIALGNINTLDMGLSSMMTIALCALLLAMHHSTSPLASRNWMLLCWVGMGLAVLSKGLIGIVLPGAVLVIYTALTRDISIWKKLHIGKGLLVFFAVTAPWFILVSIKNPEFAHFFFVHEHLQRFTSEVHHRAGPWYYFIPLILLGVLPWLGVLFPTLHHSWQRTDDASSTFAPRKLLLIWCVFIFIFFSVSGSKLPSYILPIFPALALLMACYWDSASTRLHNIGIIVFMVMSAVGICYTPFVHTLAKSALEIPLYLAYQRWISVATAIAFIGSVAAFYALKRYGHMLAATILAIAGFVCFQLLLIGHNGIGTHASGKLLAPLIEREITPSTTLYLVGKLDHTLIFYLRRPMVMVENPDELQFGLSHAPDRWVPTRALFVKRWAEPGKAIAVTSPKIYQELKQNGLIMRIISADNRRVIITNDTSL